MWDDTIYQYRGRETEWAAMCALDAVESDVIGAFSEADADKLVGFAWDFVLQSCADAKARVPDRAEVIEIVRRGIRSRNSRNAE